MTHCIAEQFHQMAQYFAEHQIVKLNKDTSLDNQNLKNQKKNATRGAQNGQQGLECGQPLG